MNRKLIFLPGLAANGEKNPGRKVIKSGLARPLINLCDSKGWDYDTPYKWDTTYDIADAVRQVKAMLQDRPDNKRVLVVASSFGGWIMLKALIDKGWFPQLAGVVLLNPFFSAAAVVEKFPTWSQSAVIGLASRFGFPRYNGLKSFMVPATMVKSMLDPANQVLDDAKVFPLGGEIKLLDNPKGRSGFKTDAAMDALGGMLGHHPIVCDDREVVAYIGNWMDRIDQSSATTI